MTEKYIPYSVDGRDYKIPESKAKDFEDAYPTATIKMKVDDRDYKIPFGQKDSFLKHYSNATYAIDETSAPIASLDTENKSEDEVTWWDTLKKGTGGMLAGVGSSILNATIQATSGTMMNPRTGEYFKGVDYEDRIDDMSDPLVRAQKKAEETSERLAKEADPTGGNVGYVDLIKEGKFGTAMQKGLADMIQSAPMTLAAYNPYTMAINAVLMASDNYAKETRDNPEVDDWKRMAYSVGGAAIEQAVEKFADPIFKYLGGGKEMTEDIAKELLENITKESADGIKKRILKTIGKVGKNTLKDAGGEGVEEIVTSFGNDALGMALDAIDGDKDYGISAQWEEFKKQNPNATKEDFAEAKAKEYADAFIGGALSSVYMSGTAQTANEIATPIRENKAREDIQKAHDYGAMLNYDSIYDTDSDVVEASTAVSDSFKDKDGNPAIGEEFISTLTSEDALMLASRAEVSSEQRTALYKLAQKKAVQEGLNESLDGRLESELNAQRITIERATENGKIVTGQHNGKDVFIKGATINKKGKISLPNGPVLVIDMRTGEQYAATDNLVAMGNMDAAEYEQKITELFTRQDALKRDFARKTMSPKAKLKAIQPFARKKILVDVGNGITEVFVESISPKGEVMIKGKKGDLGGQSILTMNAATFYDSIHRDDDGNPVVTEVEQGAEEEVTDTPVVETTEDVDYGDYEGPILVGGRLIDVMETQQDKPSNTVNYTYVDENGDMRVGSMTIDEFGTAVKQAEEQTKNPVPAPEPAPVETPEPVVNEPTPTPEPTPEPAPEETTEETDWDALFENDTVAFYDEVKKQFGDKAMDFLNMEIQATQNEISSLEKNMGKSTNERAKNFSKLASLRLKLGSLNEMAELLEKQSNPVAETPTEAPTEVSTEPVDETPTETTEETPTEPETEEQNPSDSQGNSVTLEDGENENNNGVRAEDETGGGEHRPSDNADGNESDGGGNQSESETDTEGGAILDSEGGEENPVDKYPVRNGDVTQDMVKTAFGFSHVANSLRSQKTLNTVYDTLMGMAKMLGISPKSIGHGGRLGLSRLGDRVDSSTWAWYERGRDWDGNVARTIVSIRDTHISSLLHEWWHSLDHALNYTNTGKGSFTTSVGKANFTGRQEVLNAVNAVMKAIKSSGHIGRIERAYYGPSHERYLKSKKEATARAFEEYILGKFAESGIAIEGIERENISSQPTAEEMEVIAPAFDNLFKVLKEKEGKAQGTTVLYHIGEQMAPQSDAKKLATEAVFMSLDEGGREIDILSDEQTEQYLKMIGADTETQFSVDTDKPIFLSNAAIAVSGIKQEKATPEQWLKMIEKAGGLKAGEDKWMGLSDWLKASDKKTLTKQEVLDFISENTIRIEEVNYGEIDYFSEDKKFIDAINNEFLELRREAEAAGEWIHDAGDIAYEQMVERYGDDFSIAFGVDLGELYVSNREAASVITGVDLGVEREINETRIGYTTDGLDNKKEIALIVPTIEPWNQHDEIHFGDAGDGRAVAWVRFGEARTYSKEYADFYDFQGKMQKKYFPDRAIQALGGSDLDALTEEERAEFERLREIAKSIPAKNRTNRKVLVIDEIQSKRHQEGREQGYSMTKEDYQKRLDSLETEAGDRLKRRTELLRTLKEKYGEDFRAYLKLENTAYVPNESVMSPEEVQEWNATSQEEINEAIDSLKKQKRAGVPDAPFDKNWHELAMKRMLRYAAENGYDAIAWTKGEQQADRYSLTKHFTTIEREDNPSINGRRFQFYGGNVETFIVDNNGVVTDSTISDAKGKPLADVVGKDLSVKMMSIEDGETLDNQAIAVGGEGMRGFYDKMLPSFMNKYGKKWGVKVSNITLPHVEKAGRIMHSVPVNEAMRESVIEGQPMFFKTPNGTVYGWTDGKKIYLTKAGINPNTPIHEYTHLWAKAMMLRNPKGWNSVKQLLKNTPVWNEVMNDANYSNIHSNEDLVASEALSRISGSENAAKLEQMAQQMIDEAKGTMRKAEARGLIQNIKDALNKFWNWVGTELFGIEKFESVEQVTDRVLWDLVNKTDLGELSEGQVETQIVTDPKVIAELEASPKRTGYRNVVQNEDGTFSSPMAYWLQSKNGGAKTRVETAKFELGKWEEAEEHPELVDEKGHVILVKPNKSTVEVAYDPYIHNRLDPVNLQFKDAWKRDELVYVETEVPETDLESGYHADEALLSVGVHSWSNGDLMLSKYDKPVRVMPWDDVADAWVERLNGEGVHFDVVPPSLRPLLVERGVEILPPHKGMGKDCIDAYDEWKNSNSENNSVSLPNVSQAIESGVWDNEALNELNNIVKDVEERKAILKRYTSSELTGLLEGGSLLVGASIISRGSEENGSQSGERVGSVEERAAETVPAITAWAKKIGIWREYSERSEEEISSSYIKSGGEAQVFSLGNGKFEKIISLKYFVDPQLAIDRIAIHNSLFEETLLTVTGFGTNRDGEFAIIVEQAAIDGKHTSNEEIDSYLDSIGFEKIDDASRTFANEELYLSDLHEENVLNQEHIRYYVIDGDFRLNTPEVGIDGTREIDDRIVRTEEDGFRSRRGDITPENVRYESKAESERRIRETLSQSSVAEDVSESGSENAGQSSRRGYAGATGRPANAESGRRVTIENQNAAVNLHTGETRDAIIERAVSEEAQKLGVNVTFAKRSEMAKGHETDKGYYNTKTGEIVICPENNASIADAIQTILHEAVAHKGLRQLMGDKFDEFINRVYDSLDAKTKEKVDKLAKDHYKGNKAVAMEEYMATLAESEDFNDKTIWDKIVEIFEDIINKILDRDDFTIGDKELRYILRASYNNMANPRNMETVRGWAQEQMMREEYKINKATPELLSRTGIDPTQVSSETAKAVYDRVVSSQWQEFERQFQDAMQPVRIAIDAIQQETGNIPIEDYENYILIQNHASSRSRVEIDEFKNKYYLPIFKRIEEAINKIIETRGGNVKNKKERANAYRELKNYLIAKHGLERNKYYQTHKQRLLNEDEKAEARLEIEDNYSIELARIASIYRGAERANQEEIAKQKYESELAGVDSMTTFDVRDYSGLTALFGLDPKQYELAESMASDAVAKFEGDVDTRELWNAINAATDKTLRHSYECGLLSRQQYEDIKNMFTHYIPLRGYDETTAEDVYSYARFEGNRFNPAVQTVKGRTSLADDPIAIIMNMAESEIAQGNKNRAKQALYNFLLNRSAGREKQNSLMHVESVWYVKSVDANGNEIYTIASPDRSRGETYEDFEARMQSMSDNGMARKSKKGKVDVGMRFQKQMDRNSHYVYLKVNGVEKAIYINGDPKAADAINGTYMPKSGEAMQMIKTVQRLVSSTFTNYSLEFTARNYFRDMVYSHINIEARESDPKYRKKFRQNWRRNNIGTMLKMLNAYRAGEYDGRPLTQDEAAFVEFMRNGGQTGYTLINSVEAHKKDLERAIERIQKGVENGGVKNSTIFRYTLGGVELLNEASELVTRFAAYKTSRDMGRGIETSIGDAKEISVNFNTKGAQDGKGWMGILARYLGAVKYFFNASVQGVQNLWKAFNTNKLKFGTIVGGTIGLGALMPVLQGALSELLGGDEDEYWNIPEYDRQNNLCFVIGNGKYVKLPLPIGFREMYGLGDIITAGFSNKKFVRNPLSVGMDVANKIATIVLPINPLEGSANGLSLIESAQDMLFPDFTQGTIQNRTNIDYKGAPIQKEYTYNEHNPQWTKAFSSNPSWLTGLSKWCYENIEYDGVGWDWSPEKLDNTFSNAFGGIYSLLKKTGRTISAIWNEDNRNLSNVPLVGVIVGSNIDDDERFVNSAYWEMDEYYNKRIYKIKTTAESFGITLNEVFARNPEGRRAGEHHPKMNEIYNSTYFDFMQEWYLGHKGEKDENGKPILDENGEPILGISQIKDKINRLETKIKKNEDGKATPEQDEELVKLNNDYETARRDIVNDLLELD